MGHYSKEMDLGPGGHSGLERIASEISDPLVQPLARVLKRSLQGHGRTGDAIEIAKVVDELIKRRIEEAFPHIST